MNSKLIEIKTWEENGQKIFLNKYADGSFTKEILVLKKGSKSEYELIQHSVIKEEYYNNCNVLPAKQP